MKSLTLVMKKEQVLADMSPWRLGKKPNLPFRLQTAISVSKEVDGGYDYSIMGADYKEIDGGFMTIRM